jgi:hypothetical protein
MAQVYDPRAREPKREKVRLARVEIDRSTQARDRKSPERVEELLEVLQAGKEFKDDPELYYDIENKCYWVGDGFHRLDAYERHGREKIWALVRGGTLRDAMIHAAGANHDHGMPRTRKDLRRAIRLLLEDEQIARMSDTTVAAMAHTTDKTVAAVKRELGIGGGTRVYTDKHGNVTEMDVSGLQARGKKNIIDSGPVNAFHELPAHVRDRLKAVLELARDLNKAQWAFLHTWLAQQLPPRPRQAVELLTTLQLEAEAGPQGPGGGEGGPDERPLF